MAEREREHSEMSADPHLLARCAYYRRESGLKAFQLLNFKKLTEAASGPAINRQVQRDYVDPPNFKHMCTFQLW